jgi:hypothetical protein
MNEDTNQLREAFAAHEHLAPDADDVLVKAQAIARSIHRRRWAVRAQSWPQVSWLGASRFRAGWGLHRATRR